MEQLGLAHEDQALALVDLVICDTETTGSSPATARLTEIAALRVRGGRVLGHFRSLVAGPDAIPDAIVALTGITNSIRADAPSEELVMAQFSAFAKGAVPVGHNLRFDLGFLNAALARSGLPLLAHGIDTLRLARQLLAGEVPNFKLATLARAFALPSPTHRAFRDVLATRALLDLLVGRAGSLGIATVSELAALRPSSARLTSLLDRVPRRPGLYYLESREGTVLYVGQSEDVHERLASYVTSDARRKVPRLVAMTERVRLTPIPCRLERRLAELAEIRRLRPPFNTEFLRRPTQMVLTLADGSRLGPLTQAHRQMVAALAPTATTHDALLARVEASMHAAASAGRFEEAEALRRLGLRLCRLVAVRAAAEECAATIVCTCAKGAHELARELVADPPAPSSDVWYWTWSILVEELPEEPSLARARRLLGESRRFLPRRRQGLEEATRSA
jgi:DNA polymerase III epsilon subunit-like protein